MTPTTGKIFKCKGVKENTNFFWRQGFTILEEYEEASLDIENKNQSDDNTLLLFDRSNLRVYVDRDQFEQVPRKGIMITQN